MWRQKVVISLLTLWAVAAGAQEVSGIVEINAPEGRARYDFRAERDADGVVTGYWRGDNLSDDTMARGEVTCLCVDGSEAWLGITITEIKEGFGGNVATPEMGYAPGGVIIWRIEDNGDGTGDAVPDRTWGIPTIQLVNSFCPPDPPVTSCEDRPDAAVLCGGPASNYRWPVVSGDIRIQPAAATDVGTESWGQVKGAPRPMPPTAGDQSDEPDM